MVFPIYPGYGNIAVHSQQMQLDKTCMSSTDTSSTLSASKLSHSTDPSHSSNGDECDVGGQGKVGMLGDTARDILMRIHLDRRSTIR